MSDISDLEDAFDFAWNCSGQQTITLNSVKGIPVTARGLTAEDMLADGAWVDSKGKRISMKRSSVEFLPSTGMNGIDPDGIPFQVKNVAIDRAIYVLTCMSRNQ